MRAEHRRTDAGYAFDQRMDSAILDVWRQALVEGAKRVTVEGQTYPVRRTAKKGLAQIDFAVSGRTVRGLEQNPRTNSRWAKLARQGAKVMQFLCGGRYIAAVADGEITRYQGTR